MSSLIDVDLAVAPHVHVNLTDFTDFLRIEF